jgi:hypothetical protein
MLVQIQRTVISALVANTLTEYSFGPPFFPATKQVHRYKLMSDHAKITQSMSFSRNQYFVSFAASICSSVAF